MSNPRDDEEPLTTWGSGTEAPDAARVRDVLLKSAGSWSPSVISLLQHLEKMGYSGSPRIVGDGYAADGRMAVTYVPGESPHPGAWNDDAVAGVGSLLRELHDVTTNFTASPAARWKPTWLRETRLGGDLVIGHGDAAPWNIVGRDGRAEALVDWESAGPIDRVTELAYAVWLNAQLHDDDVAERVGLPDAHSRAAQAHAILDGYGYPSRDRAEFIDRMIELAVHAARAEAVMAHVTPESTEAVDEKGFPVLWAITWRARSASWMIRNRTLLRNPLP